MDKKTMVGIAIVIIALMGLVASGSAYSVTVGGTPYTFNYRQEFNLTGNAVWGGDQSNYVYWIDVKNGTGTANATNGTTFNNNHASQYTTAAKWADLIITNATGTPLKQWCDTGWGDSTFVRIYFNATTIAKTGNTTLYLYYGNSTVPSQQNGNATFNWFDDFEDNTVNGWGAGAGYTLAASSVSVNASGHAMNVTKASDGWAYSTFSVPISFTANKSYEFVLRPMQTNKQFTIGPSYGASNANLVVYGPREDGKIETYWDSTTHDGTNFNLGQWYRLRGDVYNMTRYKTYLDGSLHSSGLDKVSGTCSNLNTFQLLLYYGSSNCQVTNIFIRDWATGDPTIGNIKAEETDTTPPPVAAFTVVVNRDYAPLNATFTDQSSNTPTSWAWNFGDGAANETTRNVTHVYTPYIGNVTTSFNTTLTAINGGGSGTVFALNNVTEYPLAANFTSVTQTGVAPVTIQFNQTVTNGTASGQTWFFGDGANSTSVNASHSYTTPGVYTVILNATNVYGYGWVQRINYINITAPVVANFTGSPTEGTGYVGFTDASTGDPTAWAWNWGDASANSTSKNPGHVFPAGDGNYTVTLTASKTGSSSTVVKTNYIRIYGYPIANFTSNITSGKPPRTIYFNDTSTGTGIGTMFNWSWGDGQANGTSRNMSHTYTAAGTYDVTFTSANPFYTDSIKKTGYITINPLTPPAASFTVNKTSGKIPVSIQFTDSSTYTPTGWQWGWDDGTANSTTQNPIHTFTVAGDYHVILTATNADGSGTSAPTTITATPLVPPVANFTANVTAGTKPLRVGFTDYSLNNPTSWQWNFDDGGANVTTKNATRLFTSSGLYTITLTATNDDGSGTLERVNYINVTDPVLYPFPGFTTLPTDINSDGLYEDINGNGVFDFADINIFFVNIQWANSIEPISYFDWSGNNRIDFADVIALFQEKW